MGINIDDMLRRHPAVVLLWLEDWLKQGNTICHNSEINWLGLGDSAAAYACNMYGRHTVLESMLWGSIAVTVREHLAKSETDKPGALEHAMTVRYNLIMQFGNHPGDPLCDSGIIRGWFYKVLPMRLDEARIAARSWHEKPAERKFELKWTVEWLEAMRSLAAAGRLEVDSDLGLWLDLLATIRSGARGPDVNLTREKGVNP